MARMNEEQDALEQLTLSDFKMWKSFVIKAFNNCSIIIVNNSHSIRIVSVGLLSRLLISELIRNSSLGNFTLFLNTLKILKTLL